MVTICKKKHTTWRNAINRVWKIPYIMHNNIVNLINTSINTVVEERSITFILYL